VSDDRKVSVEDIPRFIERLIDAEEANEYETLCFRKENERLNNIINELEKDMNNYYEEYKDVDDIVISENAIVIKMYLDKLKELKEKKDE
jgi:DNA-binding IscR family transcriptional regulator